MVAPPRRWQSSASPGTRWSGKETKLHEKRSSPTEKRCERSSRPVPAHPWRPRRQVLAERECAQWEQHHATMEQELEELRKKCAAQQGELDSLSGQRVETFTAEGLDIPLADGSDIPGGTGPFASMCTTRDASDNGSGRWCW